MLKDPIIFVDGNPGCGPCSGCGRHEETRFGACFKCASEAEGAAARCSVAQHLACVPGRLLCRDWFGAKTRLSWAWERLTGTGDYAPGGYFDREYPGFRP